MDVDGFLELSLMVIWNGSWWLGVNVGVWNWRCWLFGIGVGGCLELALVVVWNCRWWLLGIVVVGYEWTLMVFWNCR
jgi:hypothetical protein